MFGSEDKILVLLEYLRYKGIINDNVFNWIENFNLFSGLSSDKIFDKKISEEKKNIFALMETITFDEYRSIVLSLTMCKTCNNIIEHDVFVRKCLTCNKTLRDEDMKIDFDNIESKINEILRQRNKQ